ncbi:MAG: hypothetical protein ACFFFY_06130 [Promethearchaeota archaeon]
MISERIEKKKKDYVSSSFSSVRIASVLFRLKSNKMVNKIIIAIINIPGIIEVYILIPIIAVGGCEPHPSIKPVRPLTNDIIKLPSIIVNPLNMLKNP